MKQDRIKDRILRRAARMWGYSELEAETSFDPMVSLLLSASAAELEKLGFELESSRSRIIERVLEVMFPEEVSGVIPARTLLQVDPLENNAEVSLYSRFTTVKKQQNIYNPTETTTKKLFFSPTIKSKLTTGKVHYIAYGNVLNQIESFFYEEPIGKAEKHLPSGEIWVGIHSPNREDLEDLQFLIEINNTYQKELFFYYLKQAKVYFGSQEFILQEGYNVENNHLNLEHIMTKNYSDLEQVYHEVNQYYFSNFFTVKGKIEFNKIPEHEELFTQHFIGHQVAENKDIVWLKFKFSEAIVPDILQNVRFALNCIPVINANHETMGRRIKGRMNIIPIDIKEDSFLDLDYVTDEKGKRLDVKNYESENNDISALLRKGGVSRFDQRNASELLQYLLELIKDETAAFAGMGGNNAVEILRELNQNVASLHQSAKEKNFTQINNPYLIISSGNAETDLHCKVSFWSTAAEEANNLKPAIVFTVDSNTALNGTAVMLQASFGGRRKLSSQDKILEYRNALLTRGRVVTIADIKAFGMNHFKSLLTGIEVQKGTKKEVSLKGGFSRTIDLFLIKNQEQMEKLSPSEWQYLCESFLLKLKNASANIYPYRLFEK
jgi:hypothetical protein